MSKKKLGTGNSKVLTRMALFAKRVVQAFLADKDEPWVAACSTGLTVFVVWVFWYQPLVAYPGERGIIWFFALAVVTTLLFALSPIPKNLFTEILASCSPFLADIVIDSILFHDDLLLSIVLIGSSVLLIVAVLGVLSSLVSYEVVHAPHPITKLLSRTVSILAVTELCVVIASAGIFTVVTSAIHDEGATYFERKAAEQAFRLAVNWKEEQLDKPYELTEELSWC